MRRLIGLALVLMVLPPSLGALAPRNAAADSFPTGSIYWDNPQGPAVGSASIYGENPGNINQAFGTGIRQLFDSVSPLIASTSTGPTVCRSVEPIATERAASLDSSFSFPRPR